MNGNTKETVLIVDDDWIIRETLRAALIDDFQVVTAASGTECLERIALVEPDLILLDIDMPGPDGYQTCRVIRESLDVPVIFISSFGTLEDKLAAFDAGADDFVSKPLNVEVILRQVERAISRYTQQRSILLEKEKLNEMAMGLLHDIGRSDVLLFFMRDSIGCTDYRELASKLLQATSAYGVRCHVQVRHGDEAVTLTDTGVPSAIELAVFERCSTLGRSFRFSRRLIINMSDVSILILAMPQDEELARRIEEKILVLAESAEAICETIHVRRESALRAEALQVGSNSNYEAVEDLRRQYLSQQASTRELLQQLTDDVENTYVFLGLTERQEATVSETIRARADEILKLFELADVFDKQFASILESLRPDNGGESSVSLF